MEWRKGSQFGAYRSTSAAERAKKERIVLERDSGPRRETKKEEKGKRKVAKVTSEFAGAVRKQDTLRQIAPTGVGTRVRTLWKKTKCLIHMLFCVHDD